LINWRINLPLPKSKLTI